MSERQHCPCCINQKGDLGRKPCPGLPAPEVGGALLLVKDMLEQFWEHGGDVDGFDLQDSALKFGILVETKYDPALHGEGEDAEPGDPWYVFSPQFEAALDRKEP